VLAIVYFSLARSSATAIATPVVTVHGAPATGLVPGVVPAPPLQIPSPLAVAPASLLVEEHSADLRQLLAVSWLALAVTTVASALLGWFAAGRVLRPLRTITTTARTISAGNLHERLALSGPDDEFKRLGDTLDDLLGRLEASFEAQRRFVANASHEFRTPLTLERTLLQVALADPNATVQSLRSTCEELLASGREHERLLEALLTLASSERGLDHREPLDLSLLTAEIVEVPRPEIEDLGLRVETTLAPALISGDPALIERLVANLIDNAIRYNDVGGSVNVRAGVHDGRAVLSVANTGPVVPLDEIDRLFEPFQRLGANRTATGDGGQGLGLSIVRAITVAHDGELPRSRASKRPSERMI